MNDENGSPAPLPPQNPPEAPTAPQNAIHPPKTPSNPSPNLEFPQNSPSQAPLSDSNTPKIPSSDPNPSPPPKTPTYTYTPPTEEPDFNFRSADIGVKTAVKDSNFAKETIEAEKTTAQKLSAAKSHLQNFQHSIQSSLDRTTTSIKQNALFRTKTNRRISAIIAILILSTAGVALFFLSKTFNTPITPPKSPEQIQTELLSNLESSYQNTGFIEEPVQAIENQIRTLNQSNQPAKAYQLAREVAYNLNNKEYYQEAVQILERVDTEKLTNPDKYDYYSVIATLATLNNDKTRFEKFHNLSETIPLHERGYEGANGE